MNQLPNINFYSIAPNLKPNRHLASNISSHDTSASFNSNEKIFKSIEAKLNAQNAELIERGKVIEELKTSLSLFIDKYNKLKDDYEKEKQMGINIALSYSKGGAPQARKSFSRSINRLTISKAAIFSFKGNNSKKNAILNLEKEKGELKNDNIKLRAQLDQTLGSLEKINSLKIENNNLNDEKIELKKRLLESENKLEDIASLRAINKNLIKDTDALKLKLESSEYQNDELIYLRTYSKSLNDENEELKKKLSLSDSKMEELVSLRTANNKLNNEIDDLKKRLLSSDSKLEELASLRTANSNLKSEIDELKRKLLLSEGKLEELKSLKTAYNSLINENEDIKRRLESSESNHDELVLLRKTNSTHLRENEELKKQLQSSNKGLEEITSLKTNLNDLNIERENLKNQVQSNRFVMGELASLRTMNNTLIEEKEVLKKQLEALKKAHQEKENEWNININQFKSDNDILKRNFENLIEENDLKIQNDKDAHFQYIKEKEMNDQQLKDLRTQLNNLKADLTTEQNKNVELNKTVDNQNHKIEDYKKESSDFKTSLEENAVLMQQLQDLQEKLNQISLKALPSRTFNPLSIGKVETALEYVSQKVIEPKQAPDVNNPQNEAQLKALSQLQIEKESLIKKAKELSDVLLKSKTRQKDSGKIIMKNISTIKESLISTYEGYNISILNVQKKVDDTLLSFNSKIAKIKKGLKILNKQTKNGNSITKEKSMKEVITRLESEKDKQGIKLANYESHFKELTNKLLGYESQSSDIKDKLQLLQKDKELYLKNKKNLEHSVKELQQKLDMYITENSGKSKIIEERNEEIKKLKSKITI